MFLLEFSFSFSQRAARLCSIKIIVKLCISCGNIVCVCFFCAPLKIHRVCQRSLFLLLFCLKLSRRHFISSSRAVCKKAQRTRGKLKHKNKLCVCEIPFFSLCVRSFLATSLQIQSISFKLVDFYYMNQNEKENQCRR